MKKGDLMMVGTDTEWGDSLMKKSDLVVVMEPNSDRVWRGARVAQVLHPTLGVCYIRGCRLEVVDDTTTTLRPATR
jgi:hypothetical protein